MYRHISTEVDRQAEDQAEDRPKWSVHDGLQKFFRAEQRDVKCEMCDEGTTATQTLLATSQPKALIIQLKRFFVKERPSTTRSYNGSSGDIEAQEKPSHAKSTPSLVEMIISKNKDQVTIEEELDFGKYVPHQKTPRKYQLAGIIHHHGNSPSAGHYTADGLRSDGNEKQWVSFDDGSAYPANITKILNSPHSQRTAYVLLYILEKTENAIQF